MFYFSDAVEECVVFKYSLNCVFMICAGLKTSVIPQAKKTF